MTNGTLTEALERFGFSWEGMGGNTSALTRMNGTAEEILTTGLDADAPEHWFDPITLTIHGYGEDRTYEYADGLELLAYLDAHDGNTPTE